MKFFKKVKSSKAFKKTIAVIASASMAVSMLAVNAFAADSALGGVDYSTMVTTITSSLGQIITECINLATAVLPLGLGIMGLMKLWDVGKKFFTKATN